MGIGSAFGAVCDTEAASMAGGALMRADQAKELRSRKCGSGETCYPREHEFEGWGQRSVPKFGSLEPWAHKRRNSQTASSIESVICGNSGFTSYSPICRVEEARRDVRL